MFNPMQMAGGSNSGGLGGIMQRARQMQQMGSNQPNQPPQMNRGIGPNQSALQNMAQRLGSINPSGQSMQRPPQQMMQQNPALESNFSGAPVPPQMDNSQFNIPQSVLNQGPPQPVTYGRGQDGQMGGLGDRLRMMMQQRNQMQQKQQGQY